MLNRHERSCPGAIAMRNPPLLTRRIVRLLEGSDNEAIRYLHNQDAPAEQTVYRVLGRAGENVYRDRYAEDGSLVFLVPVWLGWFGAWAFDPQIAWIRTMNVEWAASLRKGTMVDVTGRVYEAKSNGVRLWREGDDA